MSEITKQRPKFLAIHEIRLPIAGFASILHRMSGAGLFLMLPLLVYVLQLSLDPSPDGVAAFKAVAGNPLVKLILFGLSWAFLHHFCMGIRILLIDVHVGVEKDAARKSATAVLAISLALTLVVAMKFLGVF
jgi:succinate dehydrogenase / fumarate reductase cytochrome b subunit